MRKELFIIPTIHNATSNYTSNDLAAIILSKKPQIIFEELPSNWNNTNIQINGQEEEAIKIVQNKINVVSEKVDVAFRNEIAQSIDLYKTNILIEQVISGETNCSKYCQNLQKKLRIYCEQIYSEKNTTYKYLISKKFKNSIRKKNEITEKIIKEYSRNHQLIYNYYNINNFFHKVFREEIIAYNCAIKMNMYDRGVLLIGAEHIDIRNTIKKYNKSITISD